MRNGRSETTLRRLSRYSRCLRAAIENGVEVVTSEYLSKPCGISSCSVRKDLASFGEFGKQGTGYDAEMLLRHIDTILGIQEPPPLILVGVGHLGRSILHSGVPGGIYTISAIFDLDPAKEGSTVEGMEVLGMDLLPETVRHLEYPVAVVAVSHGRAQEAVDALVRSGCRCIMSYNMEPVRVPDGVNLRYADTSTELDMLSHDISMLRSEKEE